MENFSTAQVALLPRIANLATLAVVVAATWWSSAQRPADLATIAVAKAQASRPAALPAAVPALAGGQRPGAEQAGHANTVAVWPVQATALPRDGIQAVGFQARVQR